MISNHTEELSLYLAMFNMHFLKQVNTIHDCREACYADASDIMKLFDPGDWLFSERALKLATANPFRPRWRELEAETLDLPMQDEVIAWRPGAQLWGPQSVYSEEFDDKILQVVDRLRRRLEGGVSVSDAEHERYELMSVYLLYCECGRRMDQWIDAAVRGEGNSSRMLSSPQGDNGHPDVKTLWEEFHRRHAYLVPFDNQKYKPEHLFSCFFLLRRAFYHIFYNIVGTSGVIAKLRSAVWESIVTHDLLSLMQGLHERMRDIPTLITGPSGTGKERVAEAIGRSLYIPFDAEKKDFKIDFPRAKNGVVRVDFIKSFKPVNLSALSPSLIESELFGHVKGSFTGAVRDRIGRLEQCPEHGAVFLDEVGELTAEIQVKLLRVLQTRYFQRAGENEDRRFLGKIVAATNRDLAAEMRGGRFREDFYYRLCADQISTPSLSEQLKDRPEDLPDMVKFVCRSVVGEEKAVHFADEVSSWINRHLAGYSWPGNFRELEQCVRSYTIRKEYDPIRLPQPVDLGPKQLLYDPIERACGTMAEAILEQKKSYAEIKRRLFTLVRRGTQTTKEAAELLGCDSRTLMKQLS
jgi:transcriptional regulator with AAA-type ATPase domain